MEPMDRFELAAEDMLAAVEELAKRGHPDLRERLLLLENECAGWVLALDERARLDAASGGES